MHHAHARRPLAPLALLLVLAIVALLGAAAQARAAADPGPSLGLTGLQAMLASGDPVPGHMKTVLKGTAVVDVPLSVLAVVDASTWGKLILFDSSDPRIADIGGIAAGMSGSPIYVTDGGVDKVIGAVSWGSDFSLGGTGLATPIESMTAVQDQHTSSTALSRVVASPARLAAPVAGVAGEISSLVLAPNAATAAAVAPAVGQTVMHPLALVEIGGVPSSSKAYRTLASRLEAAGLTVIPAQTSAAAAGATTPDLGPGSACAVLFSRGFWWMGVLGTVTYVDGNSAMLFGHPILGDPFAMDLGAGAIEGILTGATVDGIWPSSSTPEKIMSPTDVKGAVTQDRPSGVLARLGGSADTFPVTTDVTVAGGQHLVDATDVGQWFATKYWPGSSDSFGSGDPGAIGSVISGGLYHALDADSLAGSATTTTTVKVSDPTGAYTVSRSNVWDADGSSAALADEAAGDAAELVSSLVVDPFGLRQVHVDSVAVTAAVSSARRSGSLVDARLAAPLRVGENVVDISYYRYGSPDLQTVKATLTLPRGTGLDGRLDVVAAQDAAMYSDMTVSGPVSGGTPQTAAQVKAQLESEATNDDVIVSYTPRSALETSSDMPTPSASIDVPTGWVLSGDISKTTAQVQLTGPATVPLGSPLPLMGVVPEATAKVPVSVYVHTAGTPQPSSPRLTLTSGFSSREGATFTAVLPPAQHDQIVTVTVPALSSTGLPGSATRTIVVKAAVKLSVVRAQGKATLTARVSPRGTGGRVAFQGRRGGGWLPLGSAAVGRDGTARLSVPAGVTRVRARYTGSTLNGASAWAEAH
jgi:hypothetical protein